MIVLKNSQKFLLLSFLILIIGLTPIFLDGKADTAIDNQNSTANAFINVVAPTTNIWSITAANFNFGQQIATSTTVTANASGDSPITIVNLSGTSNSFNVQQSISDFTINNGSIILPTLGFYITIANSSDGRLIGASNVNIFKQNGQVITSGTNANGQMTSGAVTASLVVDGANHVISPGTYNATLTSTLVSGV